MSKFEQRHGVISDASGASGKPQIVKRVLETSRNDEGVYDSELDFKEVPLSEIIPRSINRYRQINIEKLAASIKKNRLIHPIVLARSEDLPETSEVVEQFKAKGQFPIPKKYVIVSGERRFRAFMLLAEEYDKDHSGEFGYVNPYEAITANILSRREAKKEGLFFEDANLETRQLSPMEGVLHIKGAVDEVNTPDKKYLALVDMSKGETLKGLPLKREFDKFKEDTKGREAYPFSESELKTLNRKFSEEKYCAYYLSEYLGIKDWSLAKIKQYHAVVKGCSDEVIDAVLDEKILYTEAFKIRTAPHEEQNRLLGIYLDKGRSAFLSEISALTEKAGASQEKDEDLKASQEKAYKTDQRYSEDLKKKKKNLERLSKNIGGSAKGKIDSLIRKMEALIKEADSIAASDKR